jgi:hypothetical protein
MLRDHKFRLLFLLLIVCVSMSLGYGQRRETYTGTVISYGNGIGGRMRTGTFDLTIDRYTDDATANQLLGLLQEGNDDRLLNQMDNQDVGRFSINGQIGPRLNVVRESNVNGQKRIFAVFRRWMNFGEVRGGYRSTDYPYGVIELYIDPRTGKGEGTYIAAARISWRQDKRSGQSQVEIENFGTYPARLMGVTERGSGR